jgi:beta-carotene hydroxylase
VLPRPLEAHEIAWPSLALSVLLAVAHVGLWIGALRFGLPLPLASVLLAVVTYYWFTPLHEAVHGNLGGRERRWVNPSIGHLAATTFLAPYPAFQILHLTHHGSVNHEGEDPDLWVAAQTRLGVLAKCLTILPYYYVFLFASLGRKDDTQRGRVLQAAAILLAFGGGFALLARAGLGAEAVWLWLLPAWLASALLAYLFDYLPHRPHDDRGRWTNARILLGGRLLTLLMAGQNYHLVHHVKPRVPFYRYAALYRELQPELERHGSSIVHLH